MLSNGIISIYLKRQNSISFLSNCKAMVFKHGSLIKFAVHEVFEEHYANKILIIAHSECHQSACLKRG